MYLRKNEMNYKMLLFLGVLFTVELAQTVVAQQNLCGSTTLKLTKTETPFNVPTSGNFTSVTKCEYLVTGETDKKITLKITSIYLGEGLNCDTDYVKVAPTKAGLAKTEMYTCGVTNDSFKVSSNQMAIEILATKELSKDFVKAVLVQSKCFHQI